MLTCSDEFSCSLSRKPSSEVRRSLPVILKVIHSEIGLGLGLAYKRCHTKSTLVVELQAAASGTSVTTAHIASSLGELQLTLVKSLKRALQHAPTNV